MSQERQKRARIQNVLTILGNKASIESIDKRIEGIGIMCADGDYTYIGGGLMRKIKGGSVKDVLTKEVEGFFEGDGRPDEEVPPLSIAPPLSTSHEPKEEEKGEDNAKPLQTDTKDEVSNTEGQAETKAEAKVEEVGKEPNADGPPTGGEGQESPALDDTAKEAVDKSEGTEVAKESPFNTSRPE